MNYNNFLLFNSDQKTADEKISYFHWQCIQNYNEFYSLHSLLKSLAAVGGEKVKIDDEFKNILLTWNQNTKIELKINMMIKTKNFKSRKELYFFLLNVLNLITHQGWYYCFSNKYYKKKGQMKKIARYVKYPRYFSISKKTYQTTCLKKNFHGNIMKNYFFIYKKYLMLIRPLWTVFWAVNFNIKVEGIHVCFPQRRNRL